MHRNKLIDLIQEELSGQTALESATHMTHFYRSPGASGYHLATDYVAQLFRNNNMDKVWVERYPLDGETKFLTQNMPLAWEPLKAELRIGNQNGTLLVSYETSPSCLPWWTPSTKEGGVAVDVVDVGTGDNPDDFEGKNVEGKAVLVRSTTVPGSFGQAVNLATAYGAIGVITDTLLYPTSPFRTRESLPEPVQLLRMPSNTPKIWAIVVNYPAAEQLASMARHGGAKVWVDIQAKTFKGEAQNLYADITGTDKSSEFIHLVSHSTAGTKPGANCASGPALMAEIGRVITTLIADGQIPRPRRTIRFQVNVEGQGTKHYVDSHPNDVDNTIVSFALDSVGHDQHKSKAALLFYHSPDSVPTFINDYFVSLMEETPKETRWVFSNDNEIPFVNFTDLPYTPWSDNSYYPSLGKASPLLMSWPDLYFHTDHLSAEMLDPAVFERCGITTTLAALELAYAGSQEAIKIMQEVTARSEFRLSRIALNNNGSAAYVKKRLVHFANRDQAAVASTRILSDEPNSNVNSDIAAVITKLQSRIKKRLSEVLKWLPKVAPSKAFDGGKVIPSRTVRRNGPGLAGTSYSALLRMSEEMNARDCRVRYDSLRIIGDEVWNFTDGERSINEISDAISAEFDFDLHPRHILELFEGLEREGYVKLDSPK